MTLFVIDADHPALPGHFPGHPVVPGVVVLDRVLAAIEAASDAGHGSLGALRLPQVKFVQPLLPGEAARIEIDPVMVEGAPPRWRFRVLRGDTLVASGEVQSIGGPA
jgi:3-hydroxyacyl-[acyl-carrier-protein] dehydratase